MSIFNRIKQGECTEVREVQSYHLNQLNGLKKAISCVGTNVAIWQHEWDYHVAAIHIKKGNGFRYNRSIYNLYQSGIKTPHKFKQAWLKENGDYDSDGKIPTVKTDFAGNERNKQESYIVARLDQDTKLKNPIDRTHLIPLPVTGIEFHRGLLIDFDGKLNRGSMNEFENKILKLSAYKDIIWITIVFITPKNGLAIREIAYDENWKLISSKTFIDINHYYYWFI